MTFAIYIILLMGFLLGVINLLPDASSLSNETINSIQYIIGFVKGWNFLLPINETINAVIIIIFYEGFMWGWHAAKGIARWLRGSSDGA